MAFSLSPEFTENFFDYFDYFVYFLPFERLIFLQISNISIPILGGFSCFCFNSFQFFS